MSTTEEMKTSSVGSNIDNVPLVKKGRDNIFVLFRRHIGSNIPPIVVSELKCLRPIRDVLDNYFECSKKGSRVRLEIIAGFVNFLSSMYCLPVLTNYMVKAGYVKTNTFAIMTLSLGVGNIVSGILSNLPIVICPPTAETIFLVNTLLTASLDPVYGNLAVVANGGALLLLGLVPPLAKFVVRLIPNCIQIGTTVGIGLLTALAGSYDMHLVINGKYDILTHGNIDDEVIIGLLGVFIIACAFLAESRNKYLYALLFGMIVWWSKNGWPTVWLAAPEFSMETLPHGTSTSTILAFSLIFLSILTIFGLSRSLCEMASITKQHESIPNFRYLLITVALTNFLSGMGFGPAFTISAEGASGISLGCKTGLASVSCGCFYLLSMFWGPFYFDIPPAATSPVLISVGLLLFMNVRRINFDEPKFSYPAFVTLIFIPFTNSTFVGLVIGYISYFMLSIVTLDIIDNVRDLYIDFFVKRVIFSGEGPVLEAENGTSTDDDNQESAVDILFDANNAGMKIEKISNPLVQGRV